MNRNEFINWLEKVAGKGILNSETFFVDAGCGNGRHSLYLFENFLCNGFAYDLSSQAILQAKGEYQKIKEKLKQNKSNIIFETQNINQKINLAEIEAQKEKVSIEITDLKKQYHQKKEIFDKLSYEVALIDEKIAFAEVGIYQPHFEFTDSEAYKKVIEDVRNRQKARISEKTAVTCETEWLLTGSKAKGKIAGSNKFQIPGVRN
jgi:SAM-dependent methyltransferase